MIRSVKIPQQRLPVLIGKRGAVKKAVEKNLDVKMDASGEEMLIDGDALNVMTAENIIRAIGRGFSPHNAFRLFDEDNALEIIALPKNEKELRRIKARIIGVEGKCWRNIERLTDTRISVYGKTVAIIGTYENVEKARQAIEKLIEGFTHASVYAFLEKHW